MFMQFVDDNGECTVASHVAGSAEGVHSDIKGDDECLRFGGEPQHASHWSQGSHHSSARYARSSNHTDT